jgi:RNA polymerase sigma factor (sigma-70 family)
MKDQQEFLNSIGGHQGIIHKVCRMYRDTVEDREDLFQEITYQLWRSYPNFKGESKVSTWMYRIALNTAIAALRKKSPELEYAEILPDFAEENRNEEMEHRQERFFAALRQLDDGEKALITLYLEDLSYRQIAEITGITESNVGVKLNRIKNKIQKLLNL